MFSEEKQNLLGFWGKIPCHLVLSCSWIGIGCWMAWYYWLLNEFLLALQGLLMNTLVAVVVWYCLLTWH